MRDTERERDTLRESACVGGERDRKRVSVRERYREGERHTERECA